MTTTDLSTSAQLVEVVGPSWFLQQKFPKKMGVLGDGQACCKI